MRPLLVVAGVAAVVGGAVLAGLPFGITIDRAGGGGPVGAGPARFRLGVARGLVASGLAAILLGRRPTG